MTRSALRASFDVARLADIVEAVFRANIML
jgi:hypothetical protein